MKIYLLSANHFDNNEIYDRVIQVLPTSRKNQLVKIKPEKSKQLSAAAGLLLCYAYSDYTGQTIASIPEISSTEHGKPYLQNNDGFHFNLSHSGDFAAIGYGNEEIGIDIQEDSNIGEPIAKRIMSAKEYKHYTSLNIEKKHLLANKLWCIKESYIKYIGIGLAYDMKNIEVEFNTDTDGIVIDSGGSYPSAYFRYYSIERQTMYHMSICQNNTELPCDYFELDPLWALTSFHTR